MPQTFFKWYLKSRDRRSNGNDTNEYLLTDRLRILDRALVGIGSSFFLAAPVAILLLGDLDPGQSLAVLCTFATLIVIILACRGMKMDAMLLALSAYFAVLVAFLSNQRHD